MNRICTIEDCNRKHYAKGYCSKHYDRFREHGDPTYVKERPIITFLLWALEQDADECIECPYNYRDEQGYMRVQIDGKSKSVHAVILEWKIGPPPNDGKEYIACHQPIVCNNPSCVNWKHLRYDTHLANGRDTILDGTNKAGETNAMAKLTEDDVYEIRRRSNAGEIGRRLVEEFNVSPATISLIINGKTWRHLSGI